MCFAQDHLLWVGLGSRGRLELFNETTYHPMASYNLFENSENELRSSGISKMVLVKQTQVRYSKVYFIYALQYCTVLMCHSIEINFNSFE